MAFTAPPESICNTSPSPITTLRKVQLRFAVIAAHATTRYEPVPLSPHLSGRGKVTTTPGSWFCRLLSTILDAHIRKSKRGGHRFESHLCSSFFLNDLAIWASIFIGFTERGRKKKHDTSSFGLSPVSSNRMLV